MQQTKLIKGVKNISKLLRDISAKMGISADFLDVKINNFHNFTKHQDIDYFKEDSSVNIDDDEVFENEEYEFEQAYDIVILKRRERANFSVIVRDNFESAHLILHKNFRMPKNENEFHEFINQLNAQKATNGIFLRKLHEEREMLREKIRDFELEKEYEIARAFRFKDSKESRLIFSDKNINAAKKNIICVAQNEHVCELHAAQNGNNGRNLAGDFMKPKEKRSTQINISSDFEQQSADGYLRYTSKESGFAVFENNALTFSKELTFTNLQIRDNCYFSGNLDSDTSLTINTQGEFEDALKEGMCVKANKITINGNIAASAIIEAHEVNITGQTHKDSKIFAKNAKINVHKGALEANMARVENLENGRVQSIKFEARRVNGGSIESEEINISELYSHALLKFSKKCDIFILKGGNNKIAFCALASKENKIKQSALKSELCDIKKKLQALELKLTKLISQYNKYQHTAKNLELIIQNNKRNNEPTQDYVLKNYNAFLAITESIKKLKKEKLELEASAKRANDALSAMQEMIYEAELVCKEGWLKYNDIIIETLQNSTSKTIIKGTGLYSVDKQTSTLVHKKIFKHTNEKISNKGF